MSHLIPSLGKERIKLKFFPLCGGWDTGATKMVEKPHAKGQDGRAAVSKFVVGSKQQHSECKLNLSSSGP